MSTDESSSTHALSEPFKKILLMIGLVSCGIYAIWTLILTFITSSSPGLNDANRIIMNLLSILLISGFIVLVNLLNKTNQIKIILYISFAIITIVYFVGLFTQIYSQIWAKFVLRILLALPVLIVYFFYWKEVLIAKILLIIRSLRLVLTLLLAGLAIPGTIDIEGLAIATNLVHVANLIILGIWFFQITQTKSISISSTQEIESTKVGVLPYTKSHGLTRILPTLIFWCETCNKQAKNIKLQSMKKEDIEKEHICPECNSVVKAFWLEPNQKLYIRWISGLSLFAGAIIVFAITNAFGWLGWAPYLFAVLSLIGAFFLNWNLLSRNFGIQRPPAHATTIPSGDPGQEFLKEAMIFGVLGLFGGLIVFGIIIGISSLL